MSQRITEKQLEIRIAYLNRITGNPETMYTKIKPATDKDTGYYLQNAGNYHLDSAYGGHGLAQMTENGGVTKIIGGFYPKKELYGLLNTYIAGIQSML